MNIIKKIPIFIFKNYKNLLKIAFAIALILLILFEGKNQIENIRLSSTLHIMRVIPKQWFLSFFLLGIVASVSMVLYDILGMKVFKYEIDKRDLFSISFVANSLNTLLGLGGLTGASVKTLLLKKRNIEFKELLSYNAIMVTSAITGLSFLAIFTLFNLRTISPLLDQHKWLLACLAVFSLYLVLYFFLDRIVKQSKVWSDSFGLKRLLKLRLNLLLISILEWVLACVLFYTIISYFEKDFNIMAVMSIFVLSSIAGILSFLPGGVGSFDLIAIMGLQILGLSPSEALTAVILYRIFYYFVPSAVAIVIFTLQVLKRTEERGYLIKSDIYGQFIATIMAIIVIACGVVLLISAFTPSLAMRFKAIESLTSITFLQFSRSISIAIGLMLLIISKELFSRVKRAYYAAMVLLFIGGIFTFIKGLDIEELVFILISMTIMRLSKTNFYRKSILIKKSHLIFIATVVFILLMIYLKVSHILLYHYIKAFHYPHSVVHGMSSFMHSGLLTYTIFMSFIVLWYLNRERLDDDIRFQGFDQQKLDLFLKTHKGHHLSHLIHLGDKNLFWAVQDQVLIAYSRSTDKAIILGDPIGEESLLSEGIQEFQKFMDTYGYRTVFYEVQEENLSMYHDNGYYFFKLGEEAIVNLENFEMTGSNRRSFRNIVKRFEKDGYGFQVLSPPFEDTLLKELESISTEWLGKRSEMGFSVGRFDKDYLQKGPAAIVKNIEENKIIAFVSLMVQDQQKERIGIDLMRFKNNVPNSTMDFIFIQLLLHFKEEGYHYFSLGVAPLSKVGSAPKSHKAEKIAHFISKHGIPIYSFEGLRKFKDKFDPDWEPRYLAYPQLMSLPALLFEISIIINIKKKIKK